MLVNIALVAHDTSQLIVHILNEKSSYYILKFKLKFFILSTSFEIKLLLFTVYNVLTIRQNMA